MRPKSEQEIWNENVANMRLKLAPQKDFERVLNESYDPIANALKRQGEGQVKTGKTLLEQAAQKIQEKEAFLAAAQDEERMRSQKGKRTR